jgi:RluA family pseudouridine synthase
MRRTCQWGIIVSETVKLSSPATHEFWEIPVRFEDQHLLALNKPTQLLTSPDCIDAQRPNLMKLLHAGIERGAPWARVRGLSYLMNAHELDFETSGVLLLAKSKPVLLALANQFGADTPGKHYVALVRGAPPQDSFTVEAKLASHPVNIGLMRVDEKGGKHSRTQFEVLEKFSGYTLMKCRPLTDRSHQVRVHLRHVGLPIVGDTLYGGSPLLLSRLKSEYRLKPNKSERPLISRVALHAEELSFLHPISGEAITITAPWPKDLTVAVKYLRRYAK